MSQISATKMEQEEPILDNSRSGLMLKTVRYSTGALTYSHGVILDKVKMLHTIREEGNRKVIITGYLIENSDSGELVQVQYWRLLRVINPEEAPVVPLRGGYNPQTRSEQQ